MEKIGDLRLVGIAHDEGNSRESGELFGRALGVAAGDDDARGRIGGVKFADGVARLGIGGSGDGASVQDDDIGRVSLGSDLAALFAQLAFDGGAIGLRGAAAKLFDVESGHYRRACGIYLTIQKSRREGGRALPGGNQIWERTLRREEAPLQSG